MEIGRTEGVQGPGNVQGPKRVSQVPSTSPVERTDRLEISDAARLISELTSMPRLRQDRIEAVRKLIEAGQFETQARLEGALEGFLGENPDIA